MKLSQRRERGFSLIELLLVLAIVAALAVAAFIIYPRVQAGRNASYEAQVLSAAQAGVKALFTTNNYANLTNDAAYNAELFPKNMNVAPGDIQNQWSGAVAVGPTTGNGTASTATIARYFAFTYPNVPTDVCIRLAGAAVQNFGTVLVGSTIVQDSYSTSQVVLDEAAIASACKGASGSEGFATVKLVSN